MPWSPPMRDDGAIWSSQPDESVDERRPDDRLLPGGRVRPTNNCVGIGQVLRARGHRVVFIVEESFAGTLQAKGFEERLMRLGPSPEVDRDPRSVLDRLHPRHGACLPQADHRAARRVHRPDLARADRRRDERRPAPGRDHLRARHRRHRRGQRRRVSRPIAAWAGLGSGSPRATRRRSRTPPIAVVLVGLPGR